MSEPNQTVEQMDDEILNGYSKEALICLLKFDRQVIKEYEDRFMKQQTQIYSKPPRAIEIEDVQKWADVWTLDMFPEYFNLDRSAKRDVILSRLVEEFGEAAKEMRKYDGRKYKGKEESSLDNIGEELSDMFIYLIRLYSLYDLNMWSELQRVIEKLETRRENAQKQRDTKDVRTSGSEV